MQPPWATEILQEVKSIKTRLKSLEKIEKTVNFISVKISDLEIKVSDIDKRVTHTENAAAFMETRYEEHNTVLIQAKQQVKSLKDSCSSFESQLKSLNNENIKTENKLLDLKMRSMKDFSMAYQKPVWRTRGL